MLTQEVASKLVTKLINSVVLLPIKPRLPQFTPDEPAPTNEKPIHAPTMLCVPETGSFNSVAISCQIPEPINK